MRGGVERAKATAPYGAAMPCAIDIERGVVTWIGIEGAAFTEPLFGMTVERLVRDGHPLMQTGLDELAAGESSDVRPAGIILHVSRCGSTLLANMLGRHPSIVAFKEPDLLSLLATAAVDDPELRPLRMDQFTAVLRAMSAAAAGVGCRAVVKLSSPLTPLAPEIAARHPDVPLVAVVRPVEEVVASLLSLQPAWASLVADPMVAARSWPGLLGALRDPPWPPHEFYAATWAVDVAAILSLGPRETLLCDYAALRDNAARALQVVLDHLGIGFDPGMLELMLASAVTYAKDPYARRPFDPLGQDARPPLSAAERRDVARVAFDAMSSLDAAVSSRTAAS